MITMRKALFYLLIFGFINSCNHNIDEIFINENLKSLFEEFCGEVSNNSYRDGNHIIISYYNVKNEGYCISFHNSDSYNSDDHFAHFKYKGFHIYVSENVPKNLIKLDNYSENLQSSTEKAKIKEYIEMYMCVEQDTTRIMKVNFKNNKYLNEWQIIE